MSTITNYWYYWSSDHPFQVYYKVRQLLLQSATAYNYFITKCDKCYYNVRELLKSATILSQSAIGITKCDDYYKGRQNKAVALCNKLEMDGRRTSKPKDKYHHRHCNNNNNDNNNNNNNNKNYNNKNNNNNNYYYYYYYYYCYYNNNILNFSSGVVESVYMSSTACGLPASRL